MVLKSLPKNSDGKKELVSHFLSFRVPKVVKVFWTHFWYLFLRRFGLWVDSEIELPPTRELNLEGWRGSEIIQIFVFVEDLFQNLKKALGFIFHGFFLPKGIHRSAQGLPKSIKSRVKMMSRNHSVSLWLPDPSQKGSRCPKGTQKWSKIVDLVIGFL